MIWFLKNKYGGYVKSLGLKKFWGELTIDERELCKESFAKSFYPNPFNKESVDNSNFKIKADLSASDFLAITATRIINQKNYVLAEKLLLKASTQEKDAIKKHNILTTLIDVYYKQRVEREDALEKCVFYCRKDIQLASKVIEEKKDIPSFKRLAIILENEAKYAEAIRVSELALKYGVSDGTKGGYEGRIEKLKSKIIS